MSAKSMTKIGGAAVLVLLLLFAALGPAKLQYRTGLGWQFDHVVGYFGFTLMFWLAWPRPFVVGGALMGTAMLLEAFQALTPDRFCDFEAALYSVAGALAAAICGDLFTRTRRRPSGVFVILQGFGTRWLSLNEPRYVMSFQGNGLSDSGLVRDVARPAMARVVSQTG
jgi:VanZ family protein